MNDDGLEQNKNSTKKQTELEPNNNPKRRRSKRLKQREKGQNTSFISKENLSDHTKATKSKSWRYLFV